MNKYICIPHIYPNIKITLDYNKELVDCLKHAFGQYLFDEPFLEYPLLDVTIEKKTDYLNIKLNESEVTKFCNNNELVIHILNHIIHIKCYAELGWHVLHEIAVAKEQDAILILAPSMGGKSTLCTYLINNGYSFLSDDMIIIEMKNYSIIPFERNIKIRKGGKDILKQSLKDIDSNLFDNNGAYYYIIPDNKKSCKKYNLKKFYSIKISTNEFTETLHYSEIFDEILNNSYFPKKILDNMSNASEIAEKFTMERIYYHNLHYALRIISESI